MTIPEQKWLQLTEDRSQRTGFDALEKKFIIETFCFIYSPPF